ncbi:ATPase family associated with various cellular activities (AAA) [Saccharicrinis carchari]|uniref:ATPase family associated with various cellular activities (AAA) n=1 Tax=Saccharicrinis carchari TaxID=1168039 RepID=A0A521CX40_SACCC|nr:ATP-binding protein [Saccharicrinis carchari]SMO63972.1 ATPase family associated with various cellular activities (AAA) [Saccharicrinis carchari]
MADENSLNGVWSFLKETIKQRLAHELRGEPIEHLNLNLESDKSHLEQFITARKLTDEEVVFLLLAMVPHVMPDFLTNIIARFLPNGGEFPAFGGVKGKNHRGILPTGETVLYILAGNDIGKRIEVSKLFDESHLFARKNILGIEQVNSGEPKMSGRLIMDEEYVDLFTSGKISKPKLSSSFPAQLITTQLEWDDLVLSKKTLSEIKEIETWLKFNHRLMGDWGMEGRIKPGYRVLFHGPAGTGKTMTASLLGKYTGRDVFRIDLSLVVSKYIGETEKNLSRLFDKADHKNWILFFDEADSIFGKRTDVRDAHDKYANQEVSYLLQRIENFGGLVILASNMKSNIDTAFVRRFNSMIEFENPKVGERLRLWQNYLPKSVTLHNDISLKEVARNYELSGANIVNIIQYACLQTIEKQSRTITYQDLIKGIQKEYKKEGKMISS